VLNVEKTEGGVQFIKTVFSTDISVENHQYFCLVFWQTDFTSNFEKLKDFRDEFI